jgi:ribosomal protein S13
MAFFLNTELSDTKPIYIVLQNIYGIGYTSSINICKKNGINPYTSLKILSKSKINNLFYFIESNFLINDLLKQKVIQNKQKLIQIKHYKGRRK